MDIVATNRKTERTRTISQVRLSPRGRAWVPIAHRIARRVAALPERLELGRVVSLGVARQFGTACSGNSFEQIERLFLSKARDVRATL